MEKGLFGDIENAAWAVSVLAVILGALAWIFGINIAGLIGQEA